MEYTGYSIYEHYKDPTQELIVKDAHNVVQFLRQVMGFEFKDIIIMGRSIGTGVSCQISKMYDFCATVSLKTIGKNGFYEAFYVVFCALF